MNIVSLKQIYSKMTTLRNNESLRTDLENKDKNTSIIKDNKTKNTLHTNNISVSVSYLRSRVQSIQNEITSLQTNLTISQFQLSFLEQLQDDTDWQRFLSEAVKQKFNMNITQLPVNVDTYKTSTQRDIIEYQAQLKVSAVKLENILSLRENVNETKINSLVEEVAQSNPYLLSNVHSISSSLNETLIR